MTKIYFKMPTHCPLCGEETRIELSDAGVKTLICTNEMCEGKIINRLDHFCGKKGLDIKGFSKATLSKFIDNNWLNSITDIFYLKDHAVEMKQLQGFGEKSVNNILAAIEDAKECSFDAYLSALGIPLVGRAVAKEISKKVDGSWETFYKMVSDRFDFSSWDSFGEAKRDNLHNFNYTEANKLISNGLIYIKESKPDIATTNSNSCKGITFCVTGKLQKFKNRDEIKMYIEEQGGKVTGSVSKNTQYLINNDVNSTSAKNVSAKQLGIPIITEEEFLKNF